MTRAGSAIPHSEKQFPDGAVSERILGCGCHASLNSGSDWHYPGCDSCPLLSKSEIQWDNRNTLLNWVEEGEMYPPDKLIRYVIAWVPMLVIAIANGALRQLTFGRVMSEIHAHQLSTLIGAVLIGSFIYVVIRMWPPSSSRQSFVIGIIWLILTVTFEFAFGRWGMHRTWVQLLGDYNPAAGRVWIVFLAWLAVAPYVFFKLRNAA